MTRIVRALCALILIAFGFALLGAAEAQACDNPSSAACQVAEYQAERIPYAGPLADERADACVRLLSTTDYAYMTEVVLVAGDDPLNGTVLASLGRGNGYSFTMNNQPPGMEDVYVREFCFQRSMIAGYDTITFCNGLNPGDGNHHTLSLKNPAEAPYLRRLQETGHVGDFLSLLGRDRTYSDPVVSFYTAELYGRMFGTYGEWLGQ